MLHVQTVVQVVLATLIASVGIPSDRADGTFAGGTPALTGWLLAAPNNIVDVFDRLEPLSACGTCN